MATIHVRNVPDKLYKRILKLAEVIQLLILGFQPRQRRADLIGRMTPPHSDLRAGMPRLKQGSEKFIRAERDER